jgi:hypothetical protein
MVRPRPVVRTGLLVLVLVLVLVLAGMVLVLASGGPARGQAIDRLPYRIRARVAIAPEVRLDARGRALVLDAWCQLVQRLVGAPWVLTVAEEEYEDGVDLEQVEPEALAEGASDFEKVWQIRIGRYGPATVLSGRELDVASLRLGPVHGRRVLAPADLPRGLLNLSQDLFRPTAAIGATSGGGVAVTVRGASLPPASPFGRVVAVGSVFRPIRIVSLSEPGGPASRVLDIPFTYLRVEAVEGPLATCAIHSALRDPLTRRVTQKNALVALGSEPAPQPTRLRFQLLPDRTPAAGYRLTARRLPDGPPREVGTTDRDGRITLESAVPGGPLDGLLALRLVAGSVEPLVEFPLMPGESSQERTLPPFDPRGRTVALETQLEALRDGVIDLVALRARLEARLKARCDGEDWDGAEAVLREFAQLPHRDTFAARLAKLKDDASAEQAKTKTAVLTRTAQAQIAELDGLIARYLDDEAFQAYAEAVAKARSPRAGDSKTKK